MKILNGTLVPPLPPKTILDEAGLLVDGPREAEYGHPADDFGAVTKAASALGLFMGVDGTNFALHHALYMILVKIQRLVHTPGHHDSLVDVAGYARTTKKFLSEKGKKMWTVLDEVKRERQSQNSKWGQQNHSDPVWSPILGEEYGEAMQEVNRVWFGGKASDDLRKELIQVAAVAVAWVECLDRWKGQE